MVPDEAYEPGARPVEQRVDLEDALARIDRRVGHRGAQGRLFRPQTADPRDRPGKGATKRLQFAHRAARMARFKGSAESIDTLVINKPFEAVAVRKKPVNTAAIARFRLTPKLIRFWKQSPSVEGDDVNRQILDEDRVRNRLILKTETRREHNSTRDVIADRRHALLKIKSCAFARQSRGYVA
jgi:hypothetical protein